MALFNKEKAQFFFSKGSDILDGAKKNIFKCRSNEIVGRECCSIKSSFAVIANAEFMNLKNRTVLKNRLKAEPFLLDRTV